MIEFLIAALIAQTIVLCLVVGAAARERRFFMDQIQLLVNKAMSPSYPAFKRAEAPQVKIDEEPKDDINPLLEFAPV